jgi:hypothetical protein
MSENYSNLFKQYSTAAPPQGSQVMTVVGVLTGGFVRLESAGKVTTASGYYRPGDRVHVMNGAIIGFAQNPVGEHLV